MNEETDTQPKQDKEEAKLTTQENVDNTNVDNNDGNKEKTSSENDEMEKLEIDNKKYLYAFYHKVDGKNNRFLILKPNRKLRQEGELEYAKQLAKFVKAGLLPKAAWGTILDNSGGTVSDIEAKSYTSAKDRFFELSFDINDLQMKDSSEENLEKMENLRLELEEVKNRIQSFELEQVYIFENTAEAKARNATIEWWLVNLAMNENDTNFFQGRSVDEKLDWYDSLDSSVKSEDEKIKIGHRFSYLITLWYLNKITSTEDFRLADISRIQ